MIASAQPHLRRTAERPPQTCSGRGVASRKNASPGVVADVIKKLACLPEGWLQ